MVCRCVVTHSDDGEGGETYGFKAVWGSLIGPRQRAFGALSRNLFEVVIFVLRLNLSGICPEHLDDVVADFLAAPRHRGVRAYLRGEAEESKTVFSPQTQRNSM